MTTVGVKELKNRLSHYLARVARGERVVVTERGRPVATLAAIGEAPAATAAWRLVEEGAASWSGGKPRGSVESPSPRQGTVADAVLEDRR
jgi:prevent-host-death family protein